GVQTALYRVTQEALNNIVKHAKARFVQVEMEIGPQGNGILLIRDDGQGFDKEESSRKICYGLRGMKERVSELNGEVKINSVKGKGTTVTVFF
ncbi:MAG TPA: histidine kinase, partial [Firmicutes bacterium]|nr:histidine kinase [Bacillota bacterium]